VILGQFDRDRLGPLDCLWRHLRSRAACSQPGDKGLRLVLGQLDRVRAHRLDGLGIWLRLGLGLCLRLDFDLEIFEQEATLSTLPAKIEHLSARLATLKTHANVADIRQRGLMVGIEIAKNSSTNEAYPADQFIGDQICMAARKQGVILRNLSDVIVLMPPLSITLEEIDMMLNALETSIEARCK